MEIEYVGMNVSNKSILIKTLPIPTVVLLQQHNLLGVISPKIVNDWFKCSLNERKFLLDNIILKILEIYFSGSM